VGIVLNLPGKKLLPATSPARVTALRVRLTASVVGLVLAASVLSACSDLDPDAVRVTDKRTPLVDAGAGNPGGKPGQSVNPGALVPVDTFLASGAIPTRLKSGPILAVRFRSNLDGVSFECEDNAKAGFRVCEDGDGYVFTDLVHGRGYQLQVRARTNDGRYDDSPLILSFVVDNVGGLPVSEEPVTDNPASVDSPVLLPVSPSELPMPVPPSGGAGQAQSRRLQIGSDMALTVPDEFLVTSYATTKTYNNTLHLMRVMGADTGTSLFAEEPCNREFERVVAGPMGYSYCDATPTREQWDSGYSARIPRNHLEIVQSRQGVADEKFFAAAFDDEPDPAEQVTSIQGLCRGAVTIGQTRGPLVGGFFSGQAIYGVIHWCQVRDRGGRWWWLGSADLDTTVVPDAAVRIRAKLIYTLAHQPGVYSGPRFATRFSERSVSLLSKMSQ
jgi:hypothetical protein